MLYTVSPKTGKLGPFSKMRNCGFSGLFSRGQQRQQCSGTYVFDGSVKQQTVVIGAENPVVNNSTIVKSVTSIPTKITQQYVRGQGRGGSGRIGASQCSLC